MATLTGLRMIGIERGKMITDKSYFPPVDCEQFTHAAMIILEGKPDGVEEWKSLGPGWTEKMYWSIAFESRSKQISIAAALLAADIDRLNEIDEAISSPTF